MDERMKYELVRQPSSNLINCGINLGYSKQTVRQNVGLLNWRRKTDMMREIGIHDDDEIPGAEIETIHIRGPGKTSKDSLRILVSSEHTRDQVFHDVVSKAV